MTQDELHGFCDAGPGPEWYHERDQEIADLALPAASPVLAAVVTTGRPAAMPRRRATGSARAATSHQAAA